MQERRVTTFVLVCGIGNIPSALATLPSSHVGEIPTQDQIDASLDGCGRLVVVGEDAALAATLTRLMRTERLDVELAYVTAAKSPAKTVEKSIAEQIDGLDEDEIRKLSSSFRVADLRATLTDDFKMDEDEGHAFVSKQPASAEEEAACKEAMDGCPVEAIGDFGEQEEA